MFLYKILKNCVKIIGCDADITPNTLKFLDYIDIKPTIIVNKYKHNSNVSSKEIFTYDKFVEAIKKENKYIVCCDSKEQAEQLKKALLPPKPITNHNEYDKLLKEWEVVNESIMLITSDTTENVILDDHDKIIYSPKIIYGLDSCMARPVYCLYMEHTISPKAMLQQICRCRNITYLRYIFGKKKFTPSRYTSLDDVKEHIKTVDSLGYNTFNSNCKSPTEI